MANPEMLKVVTTQELQPGMVIIRVVKQNGPVKIKKSGLVTSQEMVQGLLEMGIQQVAIDPEQTVEIEIDDQPEIKKSATRRMLESDAITSSRIDDSLSEQFHRSLFLPTVQDLPSAWQYYAKQYAQLIIIAIGGFGIGYSVYHYQSVFSLFVPQVYQAASPTSNNQATATLPVNSVDSVSETDNLDSATQPTLVNQPAAISHPVSKTNQKTEPDKIIENALQPVEATNKEPLVEVPKPQEAEQVAPIISKDLLNKFNKAIAQVADEPKEGSYQNSPSEADVPRIDQLPAWVLTTLPNMSFSAHMYASDTNERWVRVNGSRMVEGDTIDGTVQIIRIDPQHVILRSSGQEFSMAALTDW